MDHNSYECHITISPVSGGDLERLERIAEIHRFKVAKLVMIKEGGVEEPSKKDTFMTGHSVELADMRGRMEAACLLLNRNGYPVLRYKVEQILIDSRVDDYLKIME